MDPPQQTPDQYNVSQVVPAGEEQEDHDEEKSNKFPANLYVVIGVALLVLLFIVILIIVLLISSRAEENGEVTSSLPSSTEPTASRETTPSQPVPTVPTELKEGSKIEVSDSDSVKPSGILVMQEA